MSRKVKIIWFLLSVFAASALFIPPPKQHLLIALGICAVMLIPALKTKLLDRIRKHWFHEAVVVLLTLLVLYFALKRFLSVWFFSGTPGSPLSWGIGLILCALGFYSIYCWCQYLTGILADLMKAKMPVRKVRQIFRNLGINCLFPISACAFFALNTDLTWIGSWLGSAAAVALSVAAATQIDNIYRTLRKEPVWNHILSALSAAGICLGNAHGSDLITWIEGILGLFFVYSLLVFFWKKVVGLFSSHKTFAGMEKAEKIVYAVLIIASLVFVSYCFIRSQAFYGTNENYDIIYTSDTPSLLRTNVYLWINHAENDLRQPLFAVFAAPFMGLPYLLGEPFSNTVQALLQNYVQVLMVIAANFMLTRMLRFSARRRICFMTVSCFTFTFILFSLMMEQYMVTYFWLIFFLYLSCEKEAPDHLPFYGAGGTLLTSLATIPLLTRHSLVHEFRAWIKDMITGIYEFVIVLLAMGRLDLAFSMDVAFASYSRFTGTYVPFLNRLQQYTAFIKGCFFALPAAATDSYNDHICWQMFWIEEFDILGIILFVFAMVSLIIHRKKKSSCICGCWILLSLLVLVGMGWGTQENGLILYSLYFGWAYVVLLFQLIETLEDKLKIRWLMPVLAGAFIVVMMVFNVPPVSRMLDFAFTYYPNAAIY